MKEDFAEPQFKRKQLVINRQFQFKLILKALIPLILLLIAVTAISLLALGGLEKTFYFGSMNELIMMLSQQFGDSFENSAVIFSRIRFYILVSTIVLAIVGAVYTSYVFLYFSHRIAGPVMRFEKTFEQILAGNLRVSIVLREKDEFKETAENFNEMIEALRDRIRRIDDLNTHALETIAEMKNNTSNENRDNFEKVESLSTGIRQSIREFEF